MSRSVAFFTSSGLAAARALAGAGACAARQIEEKSSNAASTQEIRLIIEASPTQNYSGQALTSRGEISCFTPGRDIVCRVHIATRPVVTPRRPALYCRLQTRLESPYSVVM